MELATAFIWTLRILLPVILFCIYFKLQSKDENENKGNKHERQRSSGPSYSRDQMVKVRSATQGGAIPASLETIALVDQTRAPKLFAEGGRGRQRNDGGRRDRGGAGRESGKRSRKEDNRESEVPVDQEVRRETAEVPEIPEAPVFEPGQEKMHMESLLNYVAFNHKDQRRVFLPDTTSAPPPPPPPPRSAPTKVADEDAEKANSEAQMVLRGAWKVGRAEVVGVLHEKLSEQHVEISEATYTLMIEVCIVARDLKQASDFLLKMENASYNPDSSLLDKVMNLYSEQKTQKEKDKAKEAEEAAQMPMDGFSMIFPEIPEGARAKLSSQAVEFVPSFPDYSESFNDCTKLSAKAEAFVPSIPAVTEAGAEGADKKDSNGSTSLRTALKASSKPFEPTFDMGADPYMYGWPMGDEYGADAYNESGNQNGNSKKAKGKGKGKQEKDGKDKGKGKGKSSSKDDEKPSEKTKAKAKAKPKAKEKETSSEGAKTNDKKAGDKDNSAGKWKVKHAA